MTKESDQLKDLVNSSGYLFQLAVENEVRTNQAKTGFRILAREHPWKNPNDDTEGFIDLVLGQDAIRFVIECKRPKGGVWVFLLSDQKQKSVSRFRVCWTDILAGHPDLLNWHDFHLKPESPESEFCVIRGGDDKESVLERLARNVLGATEALALEETRLLRPLEVNKLGLLIPAIVTAAELKVCRFDLKDISLSDGTIDNPEFESVPWIRFRKSLSFSIGEGPGLQELSDISGQKVRTVFVINSLHLSDFLKKFDFGKSASMYIDPWLMARQIEAQSKKQD